MNFWQKNRIAILIFSVALLIRLLFALPTLTVTNLDPASVSSDGYFQIVNNLIHGNGFSRTTLGMTPVVPDSVRMPLYPLLIAAIVLLFGNYKIFFILQILIGSCIPLLGRKLALMLCKSDTIAFLTGIFLALEPLNAWLPSFMLTETVFTFFFLIGIIYFFSYLQKHNIRSILLCAIFIGLATLVRPTTQFLPFFFVIILIIKEWRPSKTLLGHVSAFLLVFSIILSPWMYRNTVVFGTPNLNVQSVSTLYAFFVPSVIALEKHETFTAAQQEFSGSDTIGGIEDINLGNTRSYKERAVSELEKHPVGIIKSLFVTVVAFFTNDGYRTFTENYKWLAFNNSGVGGSQLLKHPILLLKYPGILLIIFGRILWVVISLLALCGMWLYAKKEHYSTAAIFVFATIFYFMATTAIVGLAVNGRFRVPVDALLVMLTLYAWRYLRNLIRAKGLKTT